MSKQQSQSYHSVVEQIIDDFEATAQGPLLSENNYSKWIVTVMNYPDKQSLCPHLIVLATKFADAKALPAMEQCLHLSVAAIGQAALIKVLKEQGVENAELKAWVNKKDALSGSTPLKEGLDPGSPSSGISIRGKK